MIIDNSFKWNRLDEEIRAELSNFLFECAKDSDTIGLMTESQEENQLYIKLYVTIIHFTTLPIMLI